MEVGSCSKSSLSPAATENKKAPDWLSLSDDITRLILLKVGQIDILEHVQYVCKPWHQLCTQPDMWTNIDIFTHDIVKIVQKLHDRMMNRILIHDYSGYKQQIFESNEALKRFHDRYDAMRLHALDLSHGLVVGITVDSKNEEQHLWQIAQRSCSALRRLTLYNNSDWCPFKKAIPMLHSLQVFEAVFCSLSTETIEVLGRNAPLLHTLRWHNTPRQDFELGDPDPSINEDAFAIAKYLSRLRHLSLFANLLDHEGLQALLDNCDQLEHLDLRHCEGLDHLRKNSSLLQRCKRIKHLWLPDDGDLPGAFNYIAFNAYSYRGSSFYPRPCSLPCCVNVCPVWRRSIFAKNASLG